MGVTIVKCKICGRMYNESYGCPCDIVDKKVVKKATKKGKKK